MESTMNQQAWNQVAEVELTYKSKVKASERPKITSSHEAVTVLRLLWNEGKIDFVEEFKVILLNRAHKVLGILNASSGGVSSTIADPKLVFVAALKANATNVIISHNHPSGNLKPSLEDE